MLRGEGREWTLGLGEGKTMFQKDPHPVEVSFLFALAAVMVAVKPAVKILWARIRSSFHSKPGKSSRGTGIILASSCILFILAANPILVIKNIRVVVSKKIKANSIPDSIKFP